MIEIRKLFNFFAFLFVFLLGICIGGMIKTVQYSVTLAGCRLTQPPSGNYQVILLDLPLKKLFQNYYSRLDFVEYYIPLNMSNEDFIKSFGYGGFHYLKASDGKYFQCGFYK